MKEEEKEKQTSVDDAEIVSDEEHEEQQKRQIEVASTKKGTKELTKLDSFNNVEEMLKYAEMVIKSGLAPNGMKKPETLVSVINYGRELGLSAQIAINNVHNIAGKPTLGVHAISGMARVNGIEWNVLKDAEYLYSDGSFSPYATPEMIKQKGSPVDKVTEIEFYRKSKVHDGTNRIISRLSKTQCDKAEWTTKDTWKKMFDIMLFNRCLVIGLRKIAPDIFTGVLETSEMADSRNQVIDLDETGNVKRK